MGSQGSRSEMVLPGKKQTRNSTSGDRKPNQANGRGEDLVDVSFRWLGGGDEVFVTGTFTDWTKHLRMTKYGNVFSLNMSLPRGIYFYKYIVDGVWRFAESEKTKIDDQGNINNVIDTNELVETGDHPAEDFKKNIRRPTKENSDAEITQLSFADEAPIVPPHYLDSFLIKAENVKMMRPNTKEEDIRSAVPSLIQYSNIFYPISSLPPARHVQKYLVLNRVKL
eukprot:TRINITY_DN1347_c0_g1_i8.p1 TRINITY_DN1347_c0_g1~~TRINITY_DN1347_c0_g1_i8.p1  ORF type:complete len:224 (+),score=36.00 TRINITY_DN1347_c0_g1_i8:140-811(+)